MRRSLAFPTAFAEPSRQLRPAVMMEWRTQETSRTAGRWRSTNDIDLRGCELPLRQQARIGVGKACSNFCSNWSDRRVAVLSFLRPPLMHSLWKVTPRLAAGWQNSRMLGFPLTPVPCPCPAVSAGLVAVVSSNSTKGLPRPSKLKTLRRSRQSAVLRIATARTGFPSS